MIYFRRLGACCYAFVTLILAVHNCDGLAPFVHVSRASTKSSLGSRTKPEIRSIFGATAEHGKNQLIPKTALKSGDENDRDFSRERDSIMDRRGRSREDILEDEERRRAAIPDDDEDWYFDDEEEEVKSIARLLANVAMRSTYALRCFSLTS
jgi:hypothetical protein